MRVGRVGGSSDRAARSWRRLANNWPALQHLVRLGRVALAASCQGRPAAEGAAWKTFNFRVGATCKWWLLQAFLGSTWPPLAPMVAQWPAVIVIVCQLCRLALFMHGLTSGPQVRQLVGRRVARILVFIFIFVIIIKCGPGYNESLLLDAESTLHSHCSVGVQLLRPRQDVPHKTPESGENAAAKTQLVSPDGAHTCRGPSARRPALSWVAAANLTVIRSQDGAQFAGGRNLYFVYGVSSVGAPLGRPTRLGPSLGCRHYSD